MHQIPKHKLLKFQLEVEVQKAEKEMERCQTLLSFFDQFEKETTEGLREAQNAIMMFYSEYKRELSEIIKLMEDNPDVIKG